MERHELTELHCITPIANMQSIMTYGLLSHNGAERVAHVSIADPTIQGRRSPKSVPGGLSLHDYVNLYINARNKMMYKRLDQQQVVCVLRVDPAVVDTPHAIIVDRNASSDWARFYPSPEGLAHIDPERVFAEYWTHDDPFEAMEHGSIVCAEVLVPHRIDPAYFLGAYVSCEEARWELAKLDLGIDIQLNAYLFFR